MNARYTLPKSKRVVSSREMTLALRRGTCAADDCLVVFLVKRRAVADQGDSTLRVGITIPKKTGNAVARNHWKRLIRESFRTQQDDLPTGYDIVVRPKKGAEAKWSKIRTSLPRLVKKAARRLSKGG